MYVVWKAPPPRVLTGANFSWFKVQTGLYPQSSEPIALSKPQVNNIHANFAVHQIEHPASSTEKVLFHLSTYLNCSLI